MAPSATLENYKLGSSWPSISLSVAVDGALAMTHSHCALLGAAFDHEVSSYSHMGDMERKFDGRGWHPVLSKTHSVQPEARQR